MVDPTEAQAPSWPRPKTFAFVAVAIMAAYVLYRNERFLIDPAHPVWQHYEPFKWWLLPHGLAGACVLDESQGAARSFTIETMIQATLLMTTTGMGLVFALKRMIKQHRQWMIRSYAVALTFLETRFIIGVAGLDQPFDWATVETVVWAYFA